jgi:hypothetical protein
VAFAQYRLVVLVLAYCGLRWSELAALRVMAVDVKRRRLIVRSAVVEVEGRLEWGTPKSHESRSVPIEPALADELRRAHRGQAAGRSAVHRAGRRACCGTGTRGAPGSTVRRPRPGVDGLTPHELRHTAASLAVSAGANVLAVQRMLGHASPAITLNVYADLFDEDLDAVADRLGELRAKAAVAPALPEGGLAAVRGDQGKARRPVNKGLCDGGRYWDRTSDRSGVNLPRVGRPEGLRDGAGPRGGGGGVRSDGGDHRVG